MSSHSRFAPSSMSRLMACAGSYQLSLIAPPQEETDSTLEGTAAHEVMSAYFETGDKLPIGHITRNGVAVTKDMIDGLNVLIDYVNSLELDYVNAEQRVYMSSLHKDCWGTADLYYDDLSVTHVIDYKFGHKYVDEYENWQLISYAAGCVSDQFNPNKTVYLHVVQPRCYLKSPCRVWKTSVGELRAYWNKIRAQLEHIDSGINVKCVTSKECINCPARLGCETYKTEVNNIVGLAETPSYVPGSLLNQDHELVVLQDAMELLKGRIEVLETSVEAQLRAGAASPNYAIVNVDGRAKWNASADIRSLGDMMGVKLFKDPEPLTPAQVKKLLPKDSHSVIDAMSERTASVKLERVNHSEITRIFKGH